MTIFIVLFSITILIVVVIMGSTNTSFQIYATLSFIVGSFASMLCGFIGMRIAVSANYRTTFKAMDSL